MHQGPYSHSLAEWAITACSYFAKDLPRLKAQQKDRKWEPYFVEELRCVQLLSSTKVRDAAYFWEQRPVVSTSLSNRERDREITML